jgi:hypothetical protein
VYIYPDPPLARAMVCELTPVVARIMEVGEMFSLDTSEIRSLVLQVVLIGFKYVDRETVFKQVFPEGFVDWDMQRGQTEANILGDVHAWVTLLRLFTWPEPDRPESAPLRIQYIRAQLRACNIDVGGHSLACRLLIVQLLHGVPSLQAFELLTCDIMKKDTRHACALLLSALGDAPASPAQYEAVLAHILGRDLVIDTDAISASLAAASRHRADRARGLKMKSMASYLGRPRLRDRLQPSVAESVELDTALGTWESYTGFCQLHQFPNVLSDTVKQRLYFLASQTTWDWRGHTGTMIRHQGQFAQRLGQFPVTKPDQHVLAAVLGDMSMDGRPPFPELTAFRNRCFRSFPVSQVHKLTLSQILRLYGCAYQPSAVWKALWKGQICLMSPLIIKDVETFVQDTPFAGGAFVQLMCGRV